ncbi:unnamed protein product [Effrenium voratum]|uniref:Uncharacterized protein n=1 Tax=Effrenium voratum TaxID=2562239 RepID=A0AA36MSP8_9DINO|nr:unnamed protein product [Effrenium voratum]
MARRRAKKRTAEERALDDLAEPHSALWTCLIELWAWGSLSSPIVQKLASAARQSGCAFVISRLLRTSATAARKKETCTGISCARTLPAASLQSSAGERTESTSQAILPASEWIRSLCGHGLDAALLGSEADRVRFWERQLSSPRAVGVGYYHVRSFCPAQTVPLLLFADGASHAEHDGTVACDIAESMFLLAALPKSAAVKRESWRQLWSALVADFNDLAHGRAADGSALPLRAVVWVVSGDYEHMANEYGLPHWASFRCFWCCKQKADFFDFGDIARQTYAVEDLLDQAALEHPLTALTNFSPCMFAIDTLHCLDLGVAAHVYGNVFYELTRDWPETKIGSIQRLNRELRAHCAALAVQPPRLAPAVAALAATYGCGSTHRKRRARVTSLLASLYEAASCRDLVMPADKHEDFVNALSEFLDQYRCLRAACRDDGWHIVFKFHMLRHLDEQSKHLSPRYVWTYPGETLMSLVCQLAGSCSRGTPGRLLGVKVLEKYRVAQHLMLSGQIPVRSRMVSDELGE